MADPDDLLGSELARLNAFYHEAAPWELHRARTQHTDAFGDIVRQGEDYFARSAGPGFDQVSKLSLRSMKALLRVLFEGNEYGKALSAEIAKERRKALDQAVSGLNL